MYLLLLGLTWSIVNARPARAMVDVQAVCPRIRVELRYATPKNGIGHAVYPRGARCLLRRSVAARLCRVQTRLERQGFGLKVWDAYRPLSAQKALWAVKPDKRFVAPPRRGSKHNRGAAVDVTLVDRAGKELSMPTGFDEFSVRARPTYSGGTIERRRNRDVLRRAMLAEGFVPDRAEWWHFSAPDWRSYALTNVPLTRSGHSQHTLRATPSAVSPLHGGTRAP
jgi:zinc D-Ala-D-Ala dipeptidase